MSVKDFLLKFGKKLVLLRKANNISQKDLAYETDFEISTIYRIEKGKINPTLTTLRKIASALNTTVDELVKF